MPEEVLILVSTRDQKHLDSIPSGWSKGVEKSFFGGLHRKGGGDGDG